MLSLMFSLCIDGQPCKESRIADFFQAGTAHTMCNDNRVSMARDLANLPANAQKSFFECKDMPTFVVLQNETVSELVFEVVAPVPETKSLAKFYGSLGEPLCARNRAHYEPVLQQSAATLNATSKVFCKGA